MRRQRLAFTPLAMMIVSCSSMTLCALNVFADDKEPFRPKYEKLSTNYSKDKHNCPDIKTSPNQCAVRVSRALIGADVKMDSSYPGNLCRHGYARGAQDLGAFLKKKWGARDLGFESPGFIPKQLKGKKGVILFIDIPGYDGQGHIDLWDGTKSMTGEYWNAKTIWFWELE